MMNPFGKTQRTTLQRTRYELTEGKLIRITWPTLDQVTSTHSESRELLNDVSELRIEYLDEKGKFLKDWTSAGQNKNPLPNAVRVSLTLKKWGTLTQLYIIPGQAIESTT
jgi:general secretion pathway protein J